MADIKKTLQNAAETVKEKAGEVKDWACEKTGMCSHDTADIKPHMDVISSCGCKMGKVDHLEGDAIKLTKNDSPDGQHHFVPTDWVDHIDSHVHLNKTADETRRGWASPVTSA
jgi:hypothetical protein